MPNLWSLVFGGILGAAIASFLGVIIDRSPLLLTPYSLLHMGRSRCGHCKRQLLWWENIPVVSFILLRGKCRTCRAPIPYWLPLIEIAGAIGGVWLALWASQTITVITFITIIKFIGGAAVAAALIWIFFSDMVKGVVPDWAVVLGAVGAVLSNLSVLSDLRYLSSALAAAAFFWFLAAATRGRGMGTGDVTLAFFLGLWLGWPKILIAIWLAFLLGAAAAIGLIAARRKKFGQTVPFGPFLITGAIFAYFYGEKMLSWFL